MKENEHINLEELADIGKQLLVEDGHTTAPAARPARRKILPLLLALVALLALGLYLWSMTSKPSPSLPMAALEPIPTSLVPHIRSTDTAATPLSEAVRLYGLGEYPAAQAALLQIQAKPHADADLVALYLASTYAYAGDHKAALAQLSRINGQEYADMQEWQRYLSYQHTDPAEARQILSHIAATDGHFKQKKAKEWLGKTSPKK